MQKCYNCGKEVDDNVLICPECGALIKRYGKPEPAQEEQESPFPRESAFGAAPQPRGAVWKREDGKLRFSGYVTFWLVLCALYLGYTLLGFGCTLLIYRFRDLYFEVLGQFEEMASMAELLQSLLASLEAAPVYYISIGVLVAVQFGLLIWFIASKRKLAFYLLSGAAAMLSILQLIMGGGVSSLMFLLGPAITLALLRKSWHLLR